MNYKITNPHHTNNSNTGVFYAPAASTRGDKVVIYRYGFEMQCINFAQELRKEDDTLKKSVIRYNFAKFILQHYEAYAGDRLEMLKGAATLIEGAMFGLEDTLFRAKHGVVYTSKQLRKANTNRAELRQRLHKYQRLYNHYRQICSDDIADDIVRLYEYLEQQRYEICYNALFA